MAQLCSSCRDLSKNLHGILTSELDFRTGNGKQEYIWRSDVTSIVQAAARDCSFCAIIDYVLLKPYYDPQSLGSVPWRAASAVEDLTDENFVTAATDARGATSNCLICSTSVSKNDGGLCYRCRPRVARYVAMHREDTSVLDAAGIVPLTVAIRKTSWELYEDAETDVEGLALRGYIESSSRHPLSTNETLFRVDCSSGMVILHGNLPFRPC